MSNDIRINLDRLTFDDLPRLMRAGEGNLRADELVDLLDRVVEGGVRNRPLTLMPQVVDALNHALSGLKNSGSGSPHTSGPA